MSHELQFYIDGAWVDPVVPNVLDVIDPSNEDAFAQISLGSKADVDKAVAAAKRAFATYGFSTVAERLELLNRIVAIYKKRSKDLALALSREMGAPREFALEDQVGVGLAHLRKIVEVLKTYEFRQVKGNSVVVREPIGVVGLITPWNWPQNQITLKVGPALAAGCTMVLKPSEIAPLDAIIFAEILDEAGVPKGVFNLVNGDGPTVGQALASHPDVDMMSFTGSTRAGILVAKAAADTVKRVSQELGGKSANILFPDVDFSVAVPKGVEACFGNSGQSCNAPTRMFVPRDRHDEAASYAKAAAEKFTVGPADGPNTKLGPVVSQLQYDKIQGLIDSRHRRGRHAGCRRAGPSGRPQPRLLRPSDGVCRRDARYAHRPRGDFRAGPLHPALRQRGAGDRTGQRHGLWPCLIHPGEGYREGARGCGAPSLRQRLHQLSGVGCRSAFRRLQAVWQWPRIRRIRPGRFPRDQGHRRLRGRLNSPIWALVRTHQRPSFSVETKSTEILYEQACQTHR